jgi:MoxR-like ATPase
MNDAKSADLGLSFPFYRGPEQGKEAIEPPIHPAHFESLSRHGLDDPARYRPHPDLTDTVNTALLLGLPLLVTGEPGCGKTQLGEAVAYALGLQHLKYETKSTSQARDVFYEFDVVGRFHAKATAADPEDADPRRFIAYAGLGRAILLAHHYEDVQHLLPTGPHTFRHPGSPRRSVVVIDEVDKASRDFPNDLLNEIDRMYFRVPELGAAGLSGTPAADDPSKVIPGDLRPILIFTSNSEKKLPDAFLRRCVYFHIPDPDIEELRKIVGARLQEFVSPDTPLITDALGFYGYLRDPRCALAKRPGIAEFLNWLQSLIGQGADVNAQLADQQALVLRTLSVLFKTSEDLARARPSADGKAAGLFGQWVETRT